MDNGVVNDWIVDQYKLAGEPGFEPRQTESESVVLPLHHSPTDPDEKGFQGRGRESVGRDLISTERLLARSDHEAQGPRTGYPCDRQPCCRTG